MLKIINTADGSNSLYNDIINESYHSVNGAIQESQHVFINAGLSQFSKKEISIFEVGFGTGLNALLSYIFAENNSKKIIYNSIELFPLKRELYAQLNYANILGQNYSHIYLKINESQWNTNINISDYFSLNKIHDDIRTVELSGKYDLVYFDAFSPQVEPELWTYEIFEKLYSSMNMNSIFVTYCAKGDVRRNLQKAGFNVERIPGPAGKREMLRALKATSFKL
ncbi:MAG: hypothetical protein A2033_00450 [Bacteroidetes bacterium GWA2_31_9]|nr:MAG: hypothetical protein A2033_00450 [Bacteroidetes bacterium GWA2_31_9]